jgi:uncharacterized protein (TIGR02588 family)
MIIPLCEWILAWIGALIVLSIITFTSVQAFRASDNPPQIIFKLAKTTAIPSGYLAKVDVFNEGDRTAAQLAISGRLNHEAARELTIDYLPPHSKRSVNLFFKDDPRSGTLDLQAESFQDP